MSEFSEEAQIILTTTRNKLLLRQRKEGRVSIETIREELENMVSRFPEYRAKIDIEACHKELLRQFSVLTTISVALVDNREHKPWLTADRKNDWHYWPRHMAWLERDERRAVSEIEKLDESTDKILGLLEDPKRTGMWDRRGLVVGNIQSGKTGNYSALICKAADAGYKIIIVLAGLYNNLRSQTQDRLEKTFLGFTTDDNNQKIIVGAGKYDQDASIMPNCGTRIKENGDFKKSNMGNFSISPEIRPWLFVVKKNKSVLENIVRWLKGIATVPVQDRSNKVITDLPLLLIDDEADNASVDTASGAMNDDTPNEDHDPKTINRLIRTILGYFTRKAYVGYTATPFANIFIHDQAHTTDEGSDLYPSSFIINLGTSSAYIGPDKVFGQDDYGKAIIRHIHDFTGWLPKKQNRFSKLLSDDIPDSLKQAVQAFILCCAARRCRGDGTKHCSMLVHVTRYNCLQTLIRDQVKAYLKNIQRCIHRRINDKPVLDSLKKLWATDFQPSMSWFRDNCSDDAGSPVSWDEILAVLDPVVMDIAVKCVNGHAKDVLDYRNNKETGFKVIAVGGDKLSRGLTLEGLSISYFIRPSNMYDTLMQMGRWFGYRPGYADLCRLYTTRELCDSYEHITEATDELREEFELMAASGETPMNFGLKVRTHPTLLVTSPMKMRSAHDIRVSFSGTAPETVTFLSEEEDRQHNLEGIAELFNKLGAPSEINPSRVQEENKPPRKWTGYLWHSVPAETVTEWLKDYRSPKEAYRTNPQHLCEFIRSMNSVSELTQWDIYLNNTGQEKEKTWKLPRVGQVVRPLRRRGNAQGRFSIKHLLGANEEEMLLDGEAWREALKLTKENRRNNSDTSLQRPSGCAIREICGFGTSGFEPRPERGMLILYLFDIYELDTYGKKNILTQDNPLVGFVLSFPGSSKGRVVTYKATSIMWRENDGD